MSQTEEDQRRKNFRLIYPISECGAIIIGKLATFNIIDMSERGIKFKCSSFLKVPFSKPGETFSGKVKLLIGEEYNISGKCIRFVKEVSEIVVHLHDANCIPLKSMYDEHRYLLNKYGKDYSKKEDLHE